MRALAEQEHPTKSLHYCTGRVEDEMQLVRHLPVCLTHRSSFNTTGDAMEARGSGVC